MCPKCGGQLTQKKGKVANRYIAIYQDRASFSNIGGSDGSTTICIADKVLRGDKEVAYTSITMEKTREIFQTEGDVEK